MAGSPGVTSSPRWEMGSEFHSHPVESQPLDAALGVTGFQGELYSTGRAALGFLVARYREARWWIPAYACPDVVEFLAGQVRTRRYQDYPDELSSQLHGIEPAPGDVVLAQDTFGLGGPACWRRWKAEHPATPLIEDLTHNCTQERYLASPADHVFASLRKSLPVADGGILFAKEGGLRLVDGLPAAGAHLKLEAMVLKAAYLGGAEVSKHAYRQLQLNGEAQLSQAGTGACLTHTHQMLHALPLGTLRERWRANRERFVASLGTEVSERAHVLQPRHGQEPGIFHVVMRFEGHSLREKVRNHLIANDVFPAVHWVGQSKSDHRAQVLSDTLLTLPTDFRYGPADIDRLLELVLEGLRTSGR